MEWTTIAVALGTGVGGALLTLPIQAKTANSKALKVLGEVYDTIVAALRKDVTELQKEVDVLKKELKKVQADECTRADCKRRIPPKN